MGKLNIWIKQEDDIVKAQFLRFKSRKQKNISKILTKSGYQRVEAECRQRYVNHLDPILDQNHELTQDELEIMYEKYELYGPKWCMIQNFLPNRYKMDQVRTQILIKNIFYGNIRLFLKKLYKHFTKKTAVFINDLKTQDLQSIHNGTQEFSGFCLIKKAMKRFRYKIDQQSCDLIIKSNQKQFFELLNKILEYKTKVRPLEENNDVSDSEDFGPKANNFRKQQIVNLQNSKQSFKHESTEKINQTPVYCQDNQIAAVQMSAGSEHQRNAGNGNCEFTNVNNYSLGSSYAFNNIDPIIFQNGYLQRFQARQNQTMRSMCFNYWPVYNQNPLCPNYSMLNQNFGFQWSESATKQNLTFEAQPCMFGFRMVLLFENQEQTYFQQIFLQN